MPVGGHLKAFWRPHYGIEGNREEIWGKTHCIWPRTGNNSILGQLPNLYVAERPFGVRCSLMSSLS